jgi:carbohydrate-selective porin OprB
MKLETIELFYRFQLAERLAITPDIQYVKNPALSPICLFLG